MNIKVNSHTVKAPMSGYCISNRILNQDENGEETHHIVLEYNDPFFAWNLGQSLGVIPPGENLKGKPNRPRLYSIASAHNSKSTQVALCVKRVTYQNSEGKVEHGLTSHFLCDLKPNDSINLVGPLGRHFILNPFSGKKHLLMATGTGVAPFKGFIEEAMLQKESQKPFIWLILGVKDKAHLLYKNEFQELARLNPNHFKFDTVCSREEQTKTGSRKYIGDFLSENQEELWTWINDETASAFICGIKGMETGIDKCMQILGRKKRFNWIELKAKWEKSGKWKKEVY